MTTIPSREDRFKNYYEKEYKTITEAINKAILSGSTHTDNKGCRFVFAPIEGMKYIEEDLWEYLKDLYLKAGWILETDYRDEVFHGIDVYYGKKSGE